MQSKKDTDILIGMDQIRPVLNNISEATVIRIKRDFENFPIKKLRGQWVSSRKKLEDWWWWYLESEEE
ncbi:MAG: hypothetical protein DRP56_04580 [Planctomycetota bacterium]|nr:MAG: hypothetical protein DRP56_04580 [Planctomycetota bacterium]